MITGRRSSKPIHGESGGGVDPAAGTGAVRVDPLVVRGQDQVGRSRRRLDYVVACQSHQKPCGCAVGKDR
jgi:hypothetical protein